MNNEKKVALITGGTGMDASHLADLLLEKGYDVCSVVRRISDNGSNQSRIKHLLGNPNYSIYYGDVTDPVRMESIIRYVMPQEIYLLAAQSNVGESFNQPISTFMIDGLAPVQIYEIVRKVYEGYLDKVKIYFAATSEMFNGDEKSINTELTPLCPKSPYGAAKMYAYQMGKIYRESYGMFICNGILHNHSGPRRSADFVEQKIVKGLVAIIKGEGDDLELGNFDSYRDIGYSKDYVYGMWLMLQQGKPDDFILATGNTYSIRDIIKIVCGFLGIDYRIYNQGTKDEYWELGIINLLPQKIRVVEKYFRPNEVKYLRGLATKAEQVLGWKPSICFKELIKLMIDEEIKNYE